MDIKTTTYNTYFVGVSNEPEYITTLDINNVQCIFTFGWNERLNKRWFSVTTTSGNVLLPQSFITLNYIYDFNINFEILGNYKTSVFFRPKQVGITTGVLDWKNNVELVIMSLPPDEAIQERWNETHITIK